MKQIIQNLKNGDTILEDVPAPQVRKGHVLIRTHRSLVSLGTERMLVEFGKGNLISKARQQPEKVKQVLTKIKTDGLMPTLEAVFNKLDEPMPLGYCNAGEVIAVGEGVNEFRIGDRVASNGHHAEIVCVPKNLCAKIPDAVSYDEAAFTVIGAIGLQGIRLINPTFGETIVVTGLGLIGLISAELLTANGCRVIGFDHDLKKVMLAREKGIDAYTVDTTDAVKTVEQLTNGIGADGVLITASTKSNSVISEAAQMCRKKGRIVLVGVVGLDINRADFFKKELSFQVSCSYGPGRYDEGYEQRGNDYPIGYVRWTEQRNFEAVLDAIAKKKLDTGRLITETVALNDYVKIYSGIDRSHSIASILEYPVESANSSDTVVYNTGVPKNILNKGVGIIGAGNFTRMTLLPALSKTGMPLHWICSAGGLTAASLAKKYKVAASTTDASHILKDDATGLVVITTRHDQHAKFVIEALENGKHVFVEKPLALNEADVQKIAEAYAAQKGTCSVTVGYNRRFSVFSQKAKALIGDDTSDLNMCMTVNAGYIPADVWVQDMQIGGGRIIGEACHFADLMLFFTGSTIETVHMNALGTQPLRNSDNAIITLKFANGAQGVINYFSNGSKQYSKERIELYSKGRTLVLDNFRSLRGYGFNNFSRLSKKQDKGHAAQFKALNTMLQRGEKAIIPFEQIINGTLACFAAVKSSETGETIRL